MSTDEQKVVIFALYTRLSVLFLQCLSNALLPDHDADVFLPPMDTSSFSWVDEVVHFLLGGLKRWDAVYFTHIAQYGYTYENCIAFFPFFPMVVSSTAQFLSGFGVGHFSSCVLISSVIINITLFLLTARALFFLGKSVLGDSRQSFAGALLFCINPSSIFTVAPYSETLYTFLLIHALLGIEARAFFASSFLIGLSVFTRSNGLVGTGFVLHILLKLLVKSLLHNAVLYRSIVHIKMVLMSFLLVIRTLFQSAICVSICVFPFFLYQYYIYSLFCLSSKNSLPPHLISYGRLRGYIILGDSPSAWCNDTVPMSYSYIQAAHWGVGFLKYYEIQQIPNFLLATPVVFLSFKCCIFFWQLKPEKFYCLGLCDIRAVKGIFRKQCSTPNTSKDVDKDRSSIDACRTHEGDSGSWTVKLKESSNSAGRLENVVVYVFHLLGLTLFGCCFMHIQVLTRFLFSSSPLLHWYCGIQLTRSNVWNSLVPSQEMKPDSSPPTTCGFYPRIHKILATFPFNFLLNIFQNWHSINVESKFIIIYFLSYFIIGTFMFSNFLPWT